MTDLIAGTTSEWIEVSRTISGGGSCDYTEGCPCCTCDEDNAVRVLYTRMRWSESRKRHVQQNRIVLLCIDHMSEEML